MWHVNVDWRPVDLDCFIQRKLTSIIPPLFHLKNPDLGYMLYKCDIGVFKCFEFGKQTCIFTVFSWTVAKRVGLTTYCNNTRHSGSEAAQVQNNH